MRVVTVVIMVAIGFLFTATTEDRAEAVAPCGIVACDPPDCPPRTGCWKPPPGY
ncbi:hypothetical protein [Nocardioides speluncae]|uniref:hypothetical protein n=1 Tax=Nocardioides speluncae TaxID=2670337 RepID=UPI0012B16900|nr:hypothetical protein [Nocardioides speluncae]